MPLKISRVAPKRIKVELEDKWDGRGEPQIMWGGKSETKEYDRLIEMRPNISLIII